MAATAPSPEQQALIEEFGLTFEAQGMPPTAGRILGRLLMCSPERQSTAELMEALHASKASISTMTGLLTRIGLVERVRVPGERHDYFRLRPIAVQRHIQEQVERLLVVHALMDRATEVADDRSPQGLARLVEARDFLQFMADELSSSLERWAKRPVPSTTDLPTRSDTR